MTESKSIHSLDGKTIFFGLSDFLNLIVKGNNCFICGESPETKEFNDEHIIPDWILKKFKLHSKSITLPNETKIRYGSYTIPCCKDCNSNLGEFYERPISKLLNKNFSEISAEITKDPTIFQLLFKWICLIFIKVHLKDKAFLLERDTRKDSGYISDIYYWEEMHHLHCIARSHFSGATIDPNVYGTLLVLPSLEKDNYDYIDSHTGKTVMLQINEFCIIAVLNDACAGYSLLSEMLTKIKAPLSPFQIREIVAHLNFINLHLKERPVYHSKITIEGHYTIGAKLPDKIILLDKDEQISSPGEFLRFYVEKLIGKPEDEETNQILEELEEGRRTYLFDEYGNFKDYSQEQ